MITIDFTGKLAVVTGGSGEVGRVICRTLARTGADVAVQYYHGAQRAEELVAELREMGVRVQAYCCDITDYEDVLSMRDKIHDTMGVPDIVVDAALIGCPPMPILEQPDEDYLSQFESCVMHNVYMAKAFIPGMQQKKYGRFIGINTEAAMECNVNWSAYAAAKRGMDGILRILAKEVATDGITVNQIAPGWVITDRTRQNPDDDGWYLDKVPMHCRVEDTDIANAVVFLASDLAEFVSGVFLPVCAGNIMPGI